MDRFTRGAGRAARGSPAERAEPQAVTIPLRRDGLQLDEHRRFQERFWVAERVPTVLISRGRPDARALRRARVGLSDVMEAARQKHGLERLDQVCFAILEVGGNISIVPKSDRN